MFDLRQHTHFLGIVGSHAYGMATEHSDIDIKGWLIPPREYFLSFHKNFEQTEQQPMPKDFLWPQELADWADRAGVSIPNERIDLTIFNIQKFIKLASACNPNIIELLFLSLEDIMICSPIGEELLAHRDLFLSAKAKFTYTGYAFSQLKRIRTHRRWLVDPPKEKPERKDYGLPKGRSVISKEQYGAFDKLFEKQSRLWLLEEAEIDDELLGELHEGMVSILELEDIDELRQKARRAAAIKYGISDNAIEIMELEKRYRRDVQEWNQYQHWLEVRNPQRAELEKKYGYDTKHASHLIRLLVQGFQILTEGTLTVKDPDFAEYLQMVRRGGLTYDLLVETAEKAQEDMDHIYQDKSYVVPKSPDINAIDKIGIELIERSIKY